MADRPPVTTRARALRAAKLFDALTPETRTKCSLVVAGLLLEEIDKTPQEIDALLAEKSFECAVSVISSFLPPDKGTAIPQTMLTTCDDVANTYGAKATHQHGQAHGPWGQIAGATPSEASSVDDPCARANGPEEVLWSAFDCSSTSLLMGLHVLGEVLVRNQLPVATFVRAHLRWSVKLGRHRIVRLAASSSLQEKRQEKVHKGNISQSKQGTLSQCIEIVPRRNRTTSVLLFYSSSTSVLLFDSSSSSSSMKAESLLERDTLEQRSSSESRSELARKLLPPWTRRIRARVLKTTNFTPSCGISTKSR